MPDQQSKYISPEDYEKAMEQEMSMKAFALELYKDIAKELELEYEIEPGTIPSMYINKYNSTIVFFGDNKIGIRSRQNSYVIEINDNYCETLKKIFDVSCFNAEEHRDPLGKYMSGYTTGGMSMPSFDHVDEDIAHPKHKSWWNRDLIKSGMATSMIAALGVGAGVILTIIIVIMSKT